MTFKSIGLDISTSIVGIALLDELGHLEVVDFVDLRKIDGFIKKVESFNECLHHFVEVHSASRADLFIEDKLSGFAGGRTSQQTMMKLGAFNGAASYVAYTVIGTEPIHIHPSSVKAKMRKDGLVIPKGADKKSHTLEHCRGIDGFTYAENRNGKPQPYCFDMADAYCVARAGYLTIR